MSCFVRPLAELARTGWIEGQQFDRQVRRFGDVLNRDIFNKERITKFKGVGVGISNEADSHGPAPSFAYAPSPAETLVRNVLPDVILLILFNLVFFAGAFVSFLRYDAR